MHENGLGQFIENRIHSNNFAGKIYRLNSFIVLQIIQIINWNFVYRCLDNVKQQSDNTEKRNL